MSLFFSGTEPSKYEESYARYVYHIHIRTVYILCMLKLGFLYTCNILCAASTPTLGLYVPSIALGELIELL